MRVKAPGDGAPPISDVDPAEPTEGAAPAGSTGNVSASSSAASVGKTAPTSATTAGDPVADVARRLRGGEITAKEAVELLIDDAVDRQIGRALADRKALALELKELLRKHTESDPYLASKVRRLRNRT